jgi:hypothetical protein
VRIFFVTFAKIFANFRDKSLIKLIQFQKQGHHYFSNKFAQFIIIKIKIKCQTIKKELFVVHVNFYVAILTRQIIKNVFVFFIITFT